MAATATAAVTTSIASPSLPTVAPPAPGDLPVDEGDTKTRELNPSGWVKIPPKKVYPGWDSKEFLHQIAEVIALRVADLDQILLERRKYEGLEQQHHGAQSADKPSTAPRGSYKYTMMIDLLETEARLKQDAIRWLKDTHARLVRHYKANPAAGPPDDAEIGDWQTRLTLTYGKPEDTSARPKVAKKAATEPVYVRATPQHSSAPGGKKYLLVDLSSLSSQKAILVEEPKYVQLNVPAPARGRRGPTYTPPSPPSPPDADSD
jgi:hypothetical protein